MTPGARLCALVVILGATAPASAQTLVLCDAAWMDADRVRVLVTAEADVLGDGVGYITDCSDEAATVRVAWPGVEQHERRISLVGTPAEARARLAALVLVELARLAGDQRRQRLEGAPPTEPPAEAPSEEGANEGADAAVEAPPAEGDAEEAQAAPDGAEPAADSELTFGEWKESPYYGEWKGSPYEDDAAEEVGSALTPPPPTSGEADDEPAPSANVHESWLFGIGLGAARHFLQEANAPMSGTPFQLQLRLRARVRRLLFGARLAGRRAYEGGDGGARAYSAFLGVELWRAPVGRVWVAVSAAFEAGGVRADAHIAGAHGAGPRLSSRVVCSGSAPSACFGGGPSPSRSSSPG